MDVDRWVELHTAACMVVKDIHVHVLVAKDWLLRTYFSLPNASRRYFTFTAVQTASVSPFIHTPCRD